jgi:hypothetical protein
MSMANSWALALPRRQLYNIWRGFGARLEIVMPEFRLRTTVITFIALFVFVGICAIVAIVEVLGMQDSRFHRD